MGKFKVALTWEEYGVVEVEAEDLKTAMKKACEDPDIPLPEGNYVEESVCADKQMSKVLTEDAYGKK